MLFRRNYNNQCGIASFVSYPLVKSTSSGITTTTNKAQTTASSTKPMITTTTSSSQAKCSNSSKMYANPGCLTGYSCQLTIENYVCPSGYLFDASTYSCRTGSLVSCNALSSICPNGSGYYPYPGCQKYYVCMQTTYYYYCTTGFLFDASTGMCQLASTYKCPV